MGRILSKISKLFEFIEIAYNALNFLGLLFVILLFIGALAYLLITALF
jgi:hypothetical protein